MMMRRIAGFATVFLFALVCVVHAQDDVPVTFISGHPYSARRIFNTIRPQRDGSTETRYFESLECRDAKGRVRREQSDSSSRTGEKRIITVIDPVAHRRLSWTVGSDTKKEVLITSISKLIPVTGNLPGRDSLPAILARSLELRRDPNVTGVFLGQAIVSGVEASGVRIISYAPAPPTASESGFTQLHESWLYPELGLVVREVTDDSRYGTMTVEVSDLDVSPPDPALFEPPQDYEIRSAQP